MQKIPDFTIDDIARSFACWLQKRCREKPGFESEIADVTYTSTATVKQWRSGQRPGADALLRALAYGGPRAVNEVLLEPMSLTGARWIEDEPLEGGLCAARREIDNVIDEMASHPNSAAVDAGEAVLIDIMGRVTTLMKMFKKLRRARDGNKDLAAHVIELSDRGAA